MKKMQIRERKANIKSYSGQEEEEMLMAKELEMTKLRKIMNQGTPRDRGGGEGAAGRGGGGGGAAGRGGGGEGAAGRGGGGGGAAGRHPFQQPRRKGWKLKGLNKYTTVCIIALNLSFGH